MHHVINANLASLNGDVLYHLGFAWNEETRQEIQERFGNTRFFITGGSADRMALFAKKLAEKLNIKTPFGYDIAPIGTTARYFIYKVGPVLIANHGMGMPSISILLHEVTKLLEYAGAHNCTYIRMGTSGGVGVPGGTVVLSSEGFNNKMESCYEVAVLDKTIKRPAIFCKKTREEIAAVAKDLGFPYAEGKTLSCDDFYEGQGRLDGAICEYTIDDKMNFLKKLHEHGVRNIEMEATQMASFCHKLSIPCACVCVTLLNRLEGDQVTSTHETLKGYEERPATILMEYIKRTVQ